MTGLTLQGRPALLAIAVGIVFFGRLLLNLFVWHAEYPLTTPFAKLYSSATFTRRDISVLGIAAALAVVILIVGMVIGNAAVSSSWAYACSSLWVSGLCAGPSCISSRTCPMGASSR